MKHYLQSELSTGGAVSRSVGDLEAVQVDYRTAQQKYGHISKYNPVSKAIPRCVGLSINVTGHH
jgi:hypothetical protein